MLAIINNIEADITIIIIFLKVEQILHKWQ